MNEKKLAAECKAANLGELWERMAQSPHPFPTAPLQTNAYEALCPGDKDRILGAADAALRHEVNLLGSGKVLLGENIDWSRDYKTGASWRNQYFRNIDYANPDQPSDVKFPWELSRMQWLIPAGQAYLLTGEEKYAVGVRKVLESWIAANPYAHSVNWACAMEAAMRLIVWSWLFRVFNANDSWADVEFRTDFLICFYLHGDFTLRHIERTDINGNHYTADAAGLVFAGLLLGKGHKPELWARTGWSILCEELPRQVHADGVDFEASTAYHRLVAELFLLPAMYRTAMGLDVPEFYRERLTGMGRFTAAYTQPDGQAPFWGDADDARTLPFGGQSINDHRYLSAMIGHVFEDEDLLAGFSGSAAELVWGVGLEAARNAKARARARDVRPESQAFTEGGFYIASNDVDHVFIDCGPVGLGGRGGHGHNDCLSFEAIL
ncbi:MAG: heparinase II/III family protein, partial [Gammaproteobacteria bacterium]